MDSYFYSGFDSTKGYEELINTITAKDVQNFLAQLLKQHNMIQVVMTAPEEEKAATEEKKTTPEEEKK